MPDKTSLRALIQDRKAKQLRPTYRHLFTLAPDLYLGREELEQELAAFPDRYTGDRENGQAPRANDPRRKIEKQLAELDTKIAEHTVAVTFKAPTADEMAAKVAEYEKQKLPTLAQARDLILTCFDRFDADEELDRNDFKDLLLSLTQGETYAVSNVLSNLAVSEIEIPKYVRQSVTTRQSGATSKRA
jgi:hypothetical protein